MDLLLLAFHVISLGDTANALTFFTVVVVVAPFVCTECPVEGGGGICGVRSKSPRKGLFGTPGFACCTDDMLEIFVRFGQCMISQLPVIPVLSIVLCHVYTQPTLQFDMGGTGHG